MDQAAALKEFMEFMVVQLVEHPEDASVSAFDDGPGALRFDVRLHPQDVGRLIGRQGQTVNSIRHLLDAAGQLHDLRVRVDVDRWPDPEQPDEPDDLDEGAQGASAEGQ
jgi:uncharacterized protein